MLTLVALTILIAVAMGIPIVDFTMTFTPPPSPGSAFNVTWAPALGKEHVMIVLDYYVLPNTVLAESYNSTERLPVDVVENTGSYLWKIPNTQQFCSGFEYGFSLLFQQDGDDFSRLLEKKDKAGLWSLLEGGRREEIVSERWTGETQCQAVGDDSSIVTGTATEASTGSPNTATETSTVASPSSEVSTSSEVSPTPTTGNTTNEGQALSGALNSLGALRVLGGTLVGLLGIMF